MAAIHHNVCVDGKGQLCYSPTPVETFVVFVQALDYYRYSQCLVINAIALAITARSFPLCSMLHI